MKIFIRAFLIIISFALSLPAQTTQTTNTQIENSNDCADLNPDDIPTSTELEKNIKLQMAWEYIKLQVKLAKTNISDHKKEYLIAAIIVLGAIAAYKAIKP